MPYDLDSLIKEKEHVEEEIKLFQKMVEDLMKRKLELEMLIEEAKKRKESKDQILPSPSAEEILDSVKEEKENAN